MLKRKILKQIEEFYSGSENRALMITGARQVGKSFIVDTFGNTCFDFYIKLDFIEHPEYVSLFRNVTDAEDILVRLGALFGDKMIPGHTLIFFDEVQECPEIITQIKYLVQKNDYRYILSGSLLGTIFKKIRSVPTGYLSVLRMYPMDFGEFAVANGVGENVFDALGDFFRDEKPVDEFVHQRLMKLFTLYLMVGGMPAAVDAYIKTKNLRQVQERQTEILTFYKEDIAKYDEKERLKLENVFDLIPAELNSKNKRFILKNLNEYTKYIKYDNSFLWLKNAGVALPVHCVSEPVYPLVLSQSTNLFKLFMNDVGLLAAIYGTDTQLSILNHETEIHFGAIYENVVAQELKAHGFELFYYNNRKMGELDFLIEENGKAVPIEVKSGKDYYRHKAIDNILSVPSYGIEKAYVFCGGNTEKKENITYLPIYMVSLLHRAVMPGDMIYEENFSDIVLEPPKDESSRNRD